MSEVVPELSKGLPARSLMGHTRISTVALTSLARMAAAEVLQVPAASVRVTWSDDAGSLALSLSSPMGAPSLQAAAADPACVERSGGSIIDRSLAAKDSILSNVEKLSGSKISRVDIRISGLLVRDERRVR